MPHLQIKSNLNGIGHELFIDGAAIGAGIERMEIQITGITRKAVLYYHIDSIDIDGDFDIEKS